MPEEAGRGYERVGGGEELSIAHDDPNGFPHTETARLSLDRMIERFDIELLEEAAKFIGQLPLRSREKVLYNMRKARVLNDPELFKKLNEHIWEFRTQYGGVQLRFLAFWVRRGGAKALIVATHGFVKKTSKVPDREIAHAMQLRLQYLKNT